MRGQATINCPIVLYERVEPAQARFDLLAPLFIISALYMAASQGQGPARLISAQYSLARTPWRSHLIY